MRTKMVRQERFTNLAKLVKTNRLKLQLSQMDLSRKLGYKNAQFISNVERELCALPYKKLSTLADALNLTHDQVKETMLNDHRINLNSHLGITKENNLKNILASVGGILS